MITVTFSSGIKETNKDQIIQVKDYGVRIYRRGKTWHYPWHVIRNVYDDGE